MDVKRNAAGLLTLALLLWGGAASAQDARVYELTENVRMVIRGSRTVRYASSQLMGFVNVGTPLCPRRLAEGKSSCIVQGTGWVSVDVAGGVGKLHGDFTVVTQGDNPVDGPEAVALKGTFEGVMDLSGPLREGKPYGAVTGQFRLGSRATDKVSFSGTFRLPFLLFVDPSTGASCDPAAQAPCLQVTSKPVYLDLATGGIVEVGSDEYALGLPTVRFDLKF